VSARIVSATTIPTWIPAASPPRMNPATPSATPISRPVETSFTSTQPMSRRSISPRPMARTSVVTVWLPTLPPMPTISGMNSVSAGTSSSRFSKATSTCVVSSPATNRKSSQPTRRRTSSGTLARR